MTTHALELAWIEGSYAICRLPPRAVLTGMPGGPFVSITRTPFELSVVCRADEAPEEGQREAPYALFRVTGSLELGMVGVIASIAQPLAAAGISVFTVATFDTDYVLVHASDRERAGAALVAAGHRFAAAPAPGT